MERGAITEAIVDRLDGRKLFWFGTRGDDVESAADLPNLVASYSLINAYGRRSTIEGIAHEDLSGRRVDLDRFDLDDEPRSNASMELRRHLLGRLSGPSAVFTYRPTTFLSGVCFARRDRCRYLGLFKDHQSAFEHKPWVECAVAELGLPHVPWVYVTDEEQLETVKFLQQGPVMLRRSRTTGGVGLSRVDEPARVGESWPSEEGAFVSVAPFIEDAIPVNVGAVVWKDGVTVHPASVQLVGIPSCTDRPFGYCGNDFDAFRRLDNHTIEAIDDATVIIGEWLQRHGYLGSFGVDYLVKDGIPLFTEVNPRFQGSTHASCQISVELDQSCLLLEHLGALLGLHAPPHQRLGDLTETVPPLAHFVVHRPTDFADSVDASPLASTLLARPETVRVDVMARSALRAEPGSTVARVTVRTSITESGYRMDPVWTDPIDTWVRAARSSSPSLGAAG